MVCNTKEEGRKVKTHGEIVTGKEKNSSKWCRELVQFPLFKEPQRIFFVAEDCYFYQATSTKGTLSQIEAIRSSYPFKRTNYKKWGKKAIDIEGESHLPLEIMQ